MTPEEFKQALDRSLIVHEPDRLTHHRVTDDVAAAKRHLRHRRRAQVLGALVGTLVIGIGGTAIVHRDAAPDSGQATDAGAEPTASIVREQCRTGNNQSEAATQAIYGSGEPVVPVIAANDLWTWAVLEAADEKAWAECFINPDPNSEFRSGLTAYQSAGSTSGSGFHLGTGCPMTEEGVDRKCRQFSIVWIDRLPSEVKSVRFQTNDGVTTDITTVNGFVLFNYLGYLPDGVHVDENGGLGSWRPLHQVTYLSGSQSRLAARVFDGSGSGLYGTLASGIPPLARMPSAHGAPIYG